MNRVLAPSLTAVTSAVSSEFSGVSVVSSDMVLPFGGGSRHRRCRVVGWDKVHRARARSGRSARGAELVHGNGNGFERRRDLFLGSRDLRTEVFLRVGLGYGQLGIQGVG